MQSQPKHFRSHVWKLHRNIDRQAQIIGRGARLRPADVYAVERAIIQLQIEWERFVRTFILDCATGFFVSHGRSVRKNGIITAPGSIMPACCALSYANDGVQRYIGWSRFMKAISQQLVG